MKCMQETNRNQSTVETKASKTEMTQLGRMFTYIAIQQIAAEGVQHIGTYYYYEEGSEGVKQLCKKLYELGVIKFEKIASGDHKTLLTKKGEEVLPRYLAKCADELRAGHFGKRKIDKRTSYYRAIMVRIA